MAVNITMPQLGQTTDEVKLVEWLVKVGDRVKRGDPLCHVETDKVAMDVESFQGGTVLSFAVAEDSTVQVGETIAVIGEPGEEKQKPRAAVDQVNARFDAGTNATPLVKNIARQRGIDLNRIKGTGPGGLITREDLQKYQIPDRASDAAEVSDRKADERGFEPSSAGPAESPSESPYKHSRHQLRVAESMAQSKRKIPHYYLKTTCHADWLLNAREQRTGADRTSPSVDAFFVHAVARALRRHPKLNGFMRGGRHVLSREVHVAVAVAAGEELYAPVIRNADAKEIGEIDRELRVLVAKVQSEAVAPGDLAGATFTVTNLGMLGIDEFFAVITPPQLGVLAVGKLKKTLDIDRTENMRVRTVCALTGSFDHRAVNGAEAARFMDTIKAYLQGDEI